ncbi:penicillin-binding protein [Streptomyces sp. LP05-1]|uniref:Penicillin-binding protein n=1 Tax=Streptomyces pyxinae TaxID=2970734 RepID=A0ABT2CAS1_9ACTN|nr:transglycosylase domain-containing protein [Streptomyces sp. LP05-1]MCS0634497.1 penicillin-binding protein [Streptomyces sp. LP05-1]
MGRAEARRARQRDARRADREGTGIRRFFTWKKLLGAFFGLCLLAMGTFYVIYLMVPVPTANAQATMQSNVYRYANGKILARTGEVNREIIALDKIPKPVQHTFVAAENKSFYEDNGVDFKGTARGVFNTLAGRGKQGGSTITQQYVKNYYLDQSQTATRKLKELVISLKVDQRMSKNEILAGYINTSYYGRNAYGIQAAAQAYYGVDAEKLNVAQGAYLAALLQAPTQYDWTTASPTSRKLVAQRWNYVLDNMVGEGWLDRGERAGLKFPVPHKPKPAPGMDGQTGYLVEAAKKELQQQGVSEADIDAGGWDITLSIDEKRQKELTEAVDKELEDRLDRKKNKVDATVQAGATSVDPKTGRVVAMYGGAGATQHYVSNATRRDYQPASTFKPLVFASALENESTTQDGRRIGINTSYDGTSQRPVKGIDAHFAPQNEDDVSYGPISVQEATNKSVNSVYAQMLVDVGAEKAKKTALSLGLKDGEGFGTGPAMSLGTMNASTWDMAGAYATLDNHGKKVTPSIVRSAEHKDRVPQLRDPVGDQAVSRDTADAVTKVLTGVVAEGSGRAAASSSYQAAGKTGTSENNKSAWFAGYTPELTTVVALFGEGPKGEQVSLTGTANSGRANGGGFPARIWADYTEDAVGSGGEFDLEVPDSAWGQAARGPEEPSEGSASTSPSPSRSSDKPDTSPSPSVSHSPSPSRTTTSPSHSPSTPSSPSHSPSSPSPSHSDPDPGGPGGDTGDPGEDDGGTAGKPGKPGLLQPQP